MQPLLLCVLVIPVYHFAQKIVGRLGKPFFMFLHHVVFNMIGLYNVLLLNNAHPAVSCRTGYGNIIISSMNCISYALHMPLCTICNVLYFIAEHNESSQKCLCRKEKSVVQVVQMEV